MGSELGKKQKHRQSPREIETVRGILYSLNARNILFLNVCHEIQKKKKKKYKKYTKEVPKQQQYYI